MDSRRREDLLKTIANWDRAMTGNDSDEIARYMTDDWIIIGPDGRVNDRAGFLALVRSGDLSHDVMESHDLDVRMYGEAAVVVARGVSGGRFRKERFDLVERVSCIFVLAGGAWKCASTHLSTLPS